MNYTDEQYALMEQLSAGLFVHQLTDIQRSRLAYLDDLGFVQPREDLAEGLCFLSEYGLCILSGHR